MKIGYSNLLGEFIESKSIDYDDCKNFQIVCPSCKEPVFKVSRQNENEIINYLSHYERDKSYNQECELRVDKIESSTILNTNSNSRNQRLVYFLNVLRSAIIENEYKSTEIPKSIKVYFQQLEKSKAIAKFRDMMFEYSRKHFINWTDEIFNELFDSYVEEIKNISGSFYSTSFSIVVQKRIARDIWLHLLSQKARSNYDFLFNHSYIFVITRIEEAEKIRDLSDWEIELHQRMIELMRVSRERGYRIIDSLRDYPMPVDYGGAKTLFEKIPAEITHEVFGTLLRLPYFEIIKKYNMNFSIEPKV